MYEIRDHPDSPDLDELQEYVFEPVPPAEIERRREAGDELREVNLLDHEAVDAHVTLENPREKRSIDIGTVLYRLVQLFGTPQFSEYRAGEDISWRDDETFKYLFTVTAQDDGDEWLITVHDWRVRLGVSLAAWDSEIDGDAPPVDEEDALALLRLVTNVVTEPVLCEHKEIPY